MCIESYLSPHLCGHQRWRLQTGQQPPESPAKKQSSANNPNTNCNRKCVVETAFPIWPPASFPCPVFVLLTWCHLLLHRHPGKFWEHGCYLVLFDPQLEANILQL